MPYKTVKYLLSAFCGLLINSAGLFAQPEVDQNRAVYARVDSFWTKDAGKPDFLLLNDASNFAKGDTVLFHFAISTLVYEGSSATDPDIGKVANDRNSGVYGIFLIDTIMGDTVKLNNRVPNSAFSAHRKGDFGQLIKIPTYERARFTSSFVFPEWDPDLGIGGIFPIIVNKKLILESDISANGKGFKGGKATGDYNLAGGACADGVLNVLDRYFPSASENTGAFKGESFGNIIGSAFEDTLRGRGRLLTGGGGGNGLYSGGGGGGNGGTGGNGGHESNFCAVPGEIGGQRGQAITYTTDLALLLVNRIYLGGGGGSANQSPSIGLNASNGGSGGGIFIIITDTLEMLGSRSISANGASVLDVATAGAGGGGGGGVIVMDVNTYFGNNLTLSANGGDGGSVTGVPFYTGPGGSGGGGAIQQNKSELDALVSLNTKAGKEGHVGAVETDNYGAAKGTDGPKQYNLKIPILGFLFNTIPDDQTICQGELPPQLIAGPAKGASGTYNYTWLQSDSRNGVFGPALGTNDQQSYQPPLLDDTTYYKRYAEDKIKPSINNTSEAMAINVHPRLQGNYILADDTVCFNLAPVLPLTSDSTLRGGDGNGYFYSWEKSENTNDSWTLADATIDQFDYAAPQLGTTTFFRRVVSSGACVNISDTVKVTVLPSIENNTISDDQIICNLEDAATLDGLSITQGDAADKRYQWWEIGGGTWSHVDADTLEDYTPLSLVANNYEYIRIAFSGSENACIDTSNAVSIIVYPDIAGDTISTTVDTICANLPTITLDGSVPTGGKTGDYAYYWEFSPNGINTWTFGVDADQKNFNPGTLNSDTWFRRTVYSASSDSACKSISNILKIAVLPPLSNTLTSSDATICQFTDAPQINANAASGGLTGDYRYQWQISEEGVNWTDAAIPADGISYSPGTLTDTSYFRRAVFSGPLETCVDYSDSVKILVQPAIQSNELLRPEVQDTCFASEVVISGFDISGGDGSKGYYWEESTTSGSVWLPGSDTNTQQNYTLSSLAETIWYRRIATSGECKDTTDIKIINPQVLPKLLTLTSSDDILCTTNDLFLVLDMDIDNTNLWVSYSDNFGGNFDEVPITNDIVPVGTAEDGLFEYTISEIKDENGCLSENTGGTINVQIDKSLIATINEMDFYEVCGLSFDLSTSLDDESLGAYTTEWGILNQNAFMETASSDDDATFEPVSGISSNFAILETGITFIQNTTACLGVKDTVMVKLYRPIDDIDISLPESKIMYFRDWDTITVFPDTIGVHFWELNDWALDQSAEIVDPNSNPVRIEKIPITEYKVSGDVDNTTRVNYTLTNGICPPRKLSVELIRNEVRVYEGISPNQSPGENDYLIAEGLKVEGLNTFSLQIFSSNGMMVREITQDDVDDIVVTTAPNMDDDAMVIWDGKNKNGDNFVVPGTYYYVLVLDFKGIEFVDKGFIVVK